MPNGSIARGVLRPQGAWHLNGKLPPGLKPGYYEARLRIGNSAASNPIRIPVDVPEEERYRTAAEGSPNSVAIEMVTDGKTWKQREIRVGMGSCVSVWVTGLPAHVKVNSLRVRLNGGRLAWNLRFAARPKRRTSDQRAAALWYASRKCDGAVSRR